MTTPEAEAPPKPVGTTPPKDKWDKLGVVAKLLIPLSVVGLGYCFDSALKERDTRAEYVRLAISTLQSPDTTGTAREVKKWAAAILSKLSPIPLPPELEASALGEQIARGRFQRIGGFGEDWGFLTIRSVPDQELYVYVDGHPRATTPIALNLPSGRHLIEFRTSRGLKLGTTNVELKELREMSVLYCVGDSTIVVGEVTGYRIRVEPRCGSSP